MKDRLVTPGYCFILAANFLLYFGPLHIPFAGSLWLMNAVTVLFIIATQALAVFIYSVFPKIAFAIPYATIVFFLRFWLFSLSVTVYYHTFRRIASG